MNSIAKKLGLKPGTRALTLNEPTGYMQRLAPLPADTTISSSARGEFPFIQVFATSRAAIENSIAGWLKHAAPDARFWICYPKQTSGIKTDLNRDIVCAALSGTGWRPVSIIAIDETWSALRFRPAADVKSRKR